MTNRRKRRQWRRHSAFYAQRLERLELIAEAYIASREAVASLPYLIDARETIREEIQRIYESPRPVLINADFQGPERDAINRVREWRNAAPEDALARRAARLNACNPQSKARIVRDTFASVITQLRADGWPSNRGRYVGPLLPRPRRGRGT